MRVRTSPRYGVFMALGAVLFALIGWGVSSNVEPGLQADGTRIDTTPVIGLMVVVGFVVGATIGALVAIVLDFFIGRKTRVMTAEHTQLVTEEEAGELQDTATARDDAASDGTERDASVDSPSDEPRPDTSDDTSR